MRALLVAGALLIGPLAASAQEPPPAPLAAAIEDAALVPRADPAAKSADAASEPALRTIVRKEAARVGLPPEVAAAVAEVESGFRTGAVGDVGELGLMQVRPSTARMLGLRAPEKALFDAETNARYGVRYLDGAWRMTGQDICATVMKYRAGHGETRYSQRSVAYCLRVRKLLAARGFKVTGTVPVASFGEAPPTAGRGRSRGGWGAVARMVRSRERLSSLDRSIAFSKRYY